MNNWICTRPSFQRFHGRRKSLYLDCIALPPLHFFTENKKEARYPFPALEYAVSCLFNLPERLPGDVPIRWDMVHSVKHALCIILSALPGKKYIIKSTDGQTAPLNSAVRSHRYLRTTLTTYAMRVPPRSQALWTWLRVSAENAQTINYKSTISQYIVLVNRKLYLCCV